MGGRLSIGGTPICEIAVENVAVVAACRIRRCIVVVHTQRIHNEMGRGGEGEREREREMGRGIVRGIEGNKGEMRMRGRGRKEERERWGLFSLICLINA